MNSKFKSDLKAWLRKYTTPKEQQKHPLEEFTREKGAFANVKEAVKLFLTNYGLVMFTQAQQSGNLTVSHYMTLLQKLISIINKDLMIAYFNLFINYNFKVDVKNIRL
jgi:peroxiredoxin family protein